MFHLRDTLPDAMACNWMHPSCNQGINPKGVAFAGDGRSHSGQEAQGQRPTEKAHPTKDGDEAQLVSIEGCANQEGQKAEAENVLQTPTEGPLQALAARLWFRAWVTIWEPKHVLLVHCGCDQHHGHVEHEKSTRLRKGRKWSPRCRHLDENIWQLQLFWPRDEAQEQDDPLFVARMYLQFLGPKIVWKGTGSPAELRTVRLRCGKTEA